MYVMDVQTASTFTVELKIPESSTETAAENFKVPASRQHPQAATNAEYPRSGVLTEVMDVPPMLSFTSGLRRLCLVDQT